MSQAHGRSLEVAPGDGGAPRVRWAGRSRWLEVNIGLVGEEGAMRALTPTIFVPLQALRPSHEHSCGTTKNNCQFSDTQVGPSLVQRFGIACPRHPCPHPACTDL